MGSMSQKVHPRHSAHLVVSSTGESLFLAGLNPSAIIWDHITLGKSLVSLVLQTARALVAALAYWVFCSLLFTISLPICMLLLPFLVILHCWALLSQCLIRVRRAGLALGSRHLLPPGVLCSSLEAPWQPWKDIRWLMNYKVFPIFHVPRSVQEAREAVHGHTFCPTCFVGLSVVEEIYLWVLLYYSDAMVSEPRGLNGRSRAHLPL